jgi:hypothetical protein
MTQRNSESECSSSRRMLSSESSLRERFPLRLRASRGFAGITIFLGLLFFYLCYRPIWHTDIWGHLSYGRCIWETKSLPATEPLLPLSNEIPFIDGPWLSQLIGFAIVSTPRLQFAGLQGLFAIMVTSCGAMLSWSSFRQTKSSLFALLSLSIFLFVSWDHLMILRPQLAGMVCFIVVLTRLVRYPRLKSDWLIIPAVFAFWANLHPSFLVGLGLLGGFCLGRAFDVLKRTCSVRACSLDNHARRFFGLTILAAAAVLINPYMFRLYREALFFSANENLRDLSEWQPLTIKDPEGQMIALTAFVMTGLYRLSPRRVKGWEVLTSIGLGLATLWCSRIVVWLAPVVALIITEHAFAVWYGRTCVSRLVAQPSRSSKWSLIAIAFVGAFFSFSPFGIAILTGKHATRIQSVSRDTPVFAAEYLVANPSSGMVFATYEWADYLQWAGPDDLQLFVNSHAHLIPREIWLAYMMVIEQRDGWKETLDYYKINTLILDRANRESLINKLRSDPAWISPPIERDGQVIFIRQQSKVD